MSPGPRPQVQVLTPTGKYQEAGPGWNSSQGPQRDTKGRQKQVRGDTSQELAYTVMEARNSYKLENRKTGVALQSKDKGLRL